MSEETKNNIKNVNIDNKDINLLKKGSLIMYSKEKTITNIETKETVNNIIEVTKSIVKLQFNESIPKFIQ